MDYAVQARQRRIELARACAPVPGQVAALNVDSLITDLGTGTMAILTALSKVLDKHTSIERFHQALEEFHTLQARSHLPLPRPDRNRGRAAAAMLDAVSQAVETTLDAAACPDIAQAQMLQSQAQRLLDEAAALWKAIAPAEDAWDLNRLGPSDTNAGAVPTSFLANMQRIDAQTPAAHGAHSRGSGLIAALNFAAADAFLDRHHFDALLDESLRVLDRPDVAQIAEDPEWVHQHQLAATRAAGDTTKMNRTLNDPDTTDAEFLDALMDFVDDLREVRLRYVLAALLKVGGVNVPPGGRGKGVGGAGDLIRQANDRWPGLDLDRTLSSAGRNIAAHRDYHLDNDHVVLTSTLDPDAIRIPFDEFIDAVLAQLELAMALETALEMALARHDCRIPSSPDTNKVVREAALTLVLAVAGLTEPQFSYAEDQLHISAVGTSATFHPLVAGLTSILPDHINILSIDCSDHAVMADITAFRTYQARGELDAYEDAMATITTCAAIRIDGVAPYPDPDSDWPTFVYWVGATARPNGLGALVREVKRARAICELADSKDGVETCQRLLQAARSGALDRQELPAALHL
ncbi:hypothetical protein [Mariniluteicoccus flavus]